MVTRAEGGGAPWTVTYEQASHCLQLRPGGPADEVVDEACGLEVVDDGLAGVVLSDGDRQVVAGVAPALAVLVSSDAASAPYGAVTTAIEGGSLFAYDVVDAPVDAPVDVRAVDATGETIATAAIG